MTTYISIVAQGSAHIGTMINEWSEGQSGLVTIPCDGRKYDPEVFPELKAMLRITERVRRWRWVPWITKTITFDAYGENRVPDLRGSVISDGSALPRERFRALYEAIA